MFPSCATRGNALPRTPLRRSPDGRSPPIVPLASRLHADRVAGGDCHHRHPDRPALARCPESAGGRRPHASARTTSSRSAWPRTTCTTSGAPCLPRFGLYPAGTLNYGPIFFFLLPFIENGLVWQASLSGGAYVSNNNGVQATVIKTYVCPSDPSYTQKREQLCLELLRRQCHGLQPGNFQRGGRGLPELLRHRARSRQHRRGGQQRPHLHGGQDHTGAFSGWAVQHHFLHRKICSLRPVGQRQQFHRQYAVGRPLCRLLAPYIGFVPNPNTSPPTTPYFGANGMFQVQPDPWQGTLARSKAPTPRTTPACRLHWETAACVCVPRR